MHFCDVSEHQNLRMLDITIIQLVTPNIDDYAKYSVASVRKYAMMHNYKYLIQRSQTVTDMHINWTKIDFLKDALSLTKKGEDSFVVLLDADTVIVNPKRSIEYFTDKYQKSKTNIFMAADTPFQITGKKKPNAGFVIVRNNEMGRAIIERWIEASRTDGAKYNDTHPRNQLVYWNCVEPEYKNHQIVLPKKYFHKPLWWVPKPATSNRYLYHVTSTGGKSRTSMMESYYIASYQDQANLKEIEKFLNDNQFGIASLIS
jgi:hypothetical protein